MTATAATARPRRLPVDPGRGAVDGVMASGAGSATGDGDGAVAVFAGAVAGGGGIEPLATATVGSVLI